MLEVRLFGSITALVNGEPLPALRSRRGLYLLALLTLRANREVARLWLAGTLWPESDDTRGLGNLKRSLTDLRDALGPAAALLQSPTKHTLLFTLRPEQADVLAFDEALRQDTIPSLERALSLYQAPLLEDCYEVWVPPEQEPRHEGYFAAVERLATRKQAVGELATLIPLLRQALARDRLRENVCRLLMEALVEAGNPSAASEVYRELRTQLLKDRGANPSPSLTALYQQIRTEAATPVVAVSSPKPAAPRYNLPRALTGLIGREKELEAIQACLRNACLVTLTGAGGIGKTRLALQTAWDQQRRGDGACFVDLAPLRDPAQLPRATAAALGLQEAEDQPLRESLTEFLRTRSLLLVLDNCEQVIEGAAHFVGGLLRDCPSLQVLTTSRQPLGITGEVVWRVPVLEVPQQETPSLEMVDRFAALRLFFERARAVQPGLVLTPATIQAAIEICRHLDGIALAIELAAARVKSLSVEQIAVRLDDRFRLLTGGSRSALPRQQTLRALIDWSYDLLPEDERTLLARLSLFRDSFTLAATEAICSDETLDASAILDLLERLVDKSLVLAEESGTGELRYRMLETIRQYSREKLPPEALAGLVARFYDWYLALATRAEPLILGPEQAYWLDTLDVEHNNLRQALDHSQGEPQLGLAATLCRYWYLRGHWAEGRERLQQALESASAQEGSALRARALMGAGNLARSQGDYGAAIRFYEDCLTLRRQLGDRTGMASILNNLATVVREQGDYERAPLLYQESLDLCRELGDQTGMARALHNLGMVANEQGDNARALSLYAESLALNRALGNRFLEANNLNNLSNVAIDQGDFPQARVLAEQAHAIYREVGADTGIAFCLDNLGRIALLLGDYATAAAQIEDSLRLNEELGDKRGIAISLNNLGLVALARGDLDAAETLLQQSLTLRNFPSIASTLVAVAHLAFRQGKLTRAARLHGAAEQLCTGMKRVFSLLEKRLLEDDREHLSERLGQATFDREYALGQALSVDDALLFATTQTP